MNKTFDRYIVKNIVYGTKNRIMSDAIDKFCSHHCGCDLCGLEYDCPYAHECIGPKRVARALGWRIAKI